MAQTKFWLASNSPRRKEMFAWLGWDFEVSAADIDETKRPDEPARDYVLRMAKEKADHLIPEKAANDVVIAADTIVVLDGEILGKPAGMRQARDMLKHLRNRTHRVITGIAVRAGESNSVCQDICASYVRMRAYTDEEIDAYIKSGDPLDKAGAYAIQSPSFHPAIDFSGCFASVMGMPLCHLERTLMKCSFYGCRDLAAICQNHLKYNCPIARRVMAGEDIG
ncbi:MAG: septum formation protein Maf [Anaerolineaceae bacterium]|nr:septum formation protein Maf [Anaerolineaceae bacterium]